MKLFAQLSLLTLVLTCIFISFACSQGKSPIEPMDLNTAEMPLDIPDSLGYENIDRNVLSIYNCIIDPVAETFTMEPISRSSEYHFPLSNLYPNVLQITSFGFTPNLWADIKLQHPLPGSGIDGFDPRVIAVFPANSGVRMNYPNLYVIANNSVLLDPDGYTSLHDILNVIGNANPFVAYFKDEPYRVWSSFFTTEETKRWEMNLSGFGGPISYTLIVDVSTNFPSAPQHIVDNAREPVQIDVMVGGGLRDNGGTADVEVTLLDWQGFNSIGGVKVEAPDLFTGTVSLAYSEPGPEANEYIFTGTISNDLLAASGYYNMLVAAWDDQTSIYMYNEATVYVDEIVSFTPVDVTPSGLDGFRAADVFVLGDYAYASGDAKLQIIDISTPESAFIVKTVGVKGPANGVHTTSNYAYVIDGTFGLAIIDINPPANAFVINFLDFSGIPQGIFVADGYAYIADGAYGLQIVDISTPGSEQVIKTVDTPNFALEVSVSDGYAHVADGNDIRIIDIDPPGSAHHVSTVPTPGYSEGVYSSGGYTYVAENTSGLRIIDVDPPETAHSVIRVRDLGFTHGIFAADGFAYVSCWNDGVYIIDVDPPDAPYIAGVIEVDTPLMAFESEVKNNYAYVALYDDGLRVIRIQ